jgi:rhombotail lipoprotein
MQRIALLVCLTLIATACGASRAKMASSAMPMAQASMAAPAAPPPLDRSVFARDPNGQLSEDMLQKILASPIELDLPSRVGVLPIITATDWRGPSPDYERVPAGVSPLVARLRKDAAFSLVTEMMPIPSGSMGMEALREAAARYRLRYVILYREVIAKKKHQNAWTWGYATLVGALFMPGKQHEVYGYIEATMFDVKTGVLMFTTRRSIMATKRSNEWRTNDKLAQLASNAVASFAPDLAQDFLLDVRRFANAAVAENARKTGQQDLVQVPGAGGPTVATDAPTAVN